MTQPGLARRGESLHCHSIVMGISCGSATQGVAFISAIGQPLEDKLIAMVKAARWNSEDAPIYMQRFEPSSLIANANNSGLMVHAYTLRKRNTKRSTAWGLTVCSQIVPTPPLQHVPAI